VPRRSPARRLLALRQLLEARKEFLKALAEKTTALEELSAISSSALTKPAEAERARQYLSGELIGYRTVRSRATVPEWWLRASPGARICALDVSPHRSQNTLVDRATAERVRRVNGWTRKWKLSGAPWIRQWTLAVLEQLDWCQLCAALGCERCRIFSVHSDAALSNELLVSWPGQKGDQLV
jgi:hypothetical protein